MAKSFNEYIQAYKVQMEKGDIRQAYKKLMKYMMGLRIHVAKEYPEYQPSASIQYGLMDVSFFTLHPEPLKRERLKVVVVFNHEKLRFEIWLAGQNRQVQKKYWELFEGSDWDKYRIPSKLDEGFSVMDHVLVENPDFDDLDALTRQIETGTAKFVKDIIEVLE